MKQRTIISKFIGYNVVAAVFSLLLAAVSFFIIYSLEGDVPGGSGYLRGFVIFIIIFYVLFIIADILIIRSMGSITGPIKNVAEQASLISRGLPAVKYEYKDITEVANLSASVNALIDFLIGRIDVLREVAQGIYTSDIQMVGDSDELTRAIRDVVATNSGIISEIKDYSLQIAAASVQIAGAAQNLASGSSNQAATVQEFSAVIAEVKSMSEQNAGIAQLTMEEALEHERIMTKNVEDMRHMSDAMQTITESSHRIESVIRVIDDIAFQTNILALNAAVEAARAGQHGKGFAVVADEVRELASKSAEAARETAALIKTSIENVTTGNEMVKKTSESISELGQIASRAAQNMDKLTSASKQQSSAISEITQGIGQISNVIQSNSAMAQESSASAQTMSAQSEHLKALIAKFVLPDKR
jgi:methyl-accepting chemotaxis protein